VQQLFGIAIDDFGTGYSSLRMLARLPIDTLKIDHRCPERHDTRVDVVSLERAFNMRTLAEGVAIDPLSSVA
jgi:sensor c-di-GMP phosphodiesterase-like protein